MSSHVSVRAERKLSSLSMLTLRETTAHAMGVIAINDEGNHYYNEIIIPANHPRPVRAAKNSDSTLLPDLLMNWLFMSSRETARIPWIAKLRTNMW